MAILPRPPKYRNDKLQWIEPEPHGVVDWILCTCMIVLAIPVVVVFGPLVWIIRACNRVAGKAVSHAE